MKRTISKLLGIAALALSASLAIPTTASAQASVPLYVSCAEVGTNAVKYPTDGGGVAGATHAFVCKNTNTNVQPSSSRTNTLYSAVSTGFGSNAFPASVKAQLKTANVKYFFFNNRDEGNNYFAHTAPYTSVLGPVSTFNGTTARCANTGYGWNLTTAYIAVAIYDNCTLASGNIANPSLERTILHESGHAWDFTYGSFAFPNNDLKSVKSGFRNNVNTDVTNLTPAGFSGMTPAAKDSAVCTLFAPPYFPSALEKDLGASTAGGPIVGGQTNGQVCTTSSPPVRYAPYSTNNKTPSQIALEKLPYFLTAPQGVSHYSDSWAEIFVIEAFDTASPPAFLQMTDRVLGNTLVTPRAFNCARALIRAYITTPTTTSPTLPAGCSTGSY